MNPVKQITDYYLELKDWANKSKSFYKKNNISYARLMKRAKEILELCGDVDNAKILLDETQEWADGNGLEWSIETCVKKYVDFRLIQK